jgi:hypothetical protein
VRTLPAVALVWCAASLLSPIQSAPGEIRGNVRDGRGGVLPGVTVTVSSGDLRKTAVTDAAGTYDVDGLPPGTYTITAALPGFDTAVHAGVAVGNAEGRRSDFSLCAGAFEYIDWIVPSDLAALWATADVVARVVVTSTKPVGAPCAHRDVEHTAAVREVFKDPTVRVIGGAVAFTQENWADERTPYAVGQEMVVFLTASATGFGRVAGPSSVFLVRGDRVLGRQYLGRMGSASTTEFLAKLRAMAK